MAAQFGRALPRQMQSALSDVTQALLLPGTAGSAIGQVTGSLVRAGCTTRSPTSPTPSRTGPHRGPVWGRSAGHHRIAAIEDAPFNPRTSTRQWTPDGAKRVVGQRVDRPVTVDEKVQAVADLTRDDEVAAQVATDLLKRPAVTEHVTPAEKVRVVTELTRDDTVAQEVTTSLLRRPDVARKTMRDDTTRMLVNRAQFDNSAETRERIRERTPAVRAIEHTIEYLDLVGSCHGFVATLGRLVPQLRGQAFTEDERETVRRQIGRVRAAADWLEGALDNGEFTLDEQLVQLLKGE
ncbi:DUF6192 family protein (plasmid) [Streptomyces sp. P9-2B-2]|uniref:DUF6192 family protein n=1 Tax=Streptomyces sp. P9-2B-2 TaxID=3057114 RepID=UPI0025B2B80F|nr:DUF6192 family protein [Streptomyces sp. P9-2B-2]WJY43285.1 DUF6192 family protein [Streptomyces sp. P9-2B-2]